VAGESLRHSPFEAVAVPALSTCVPSAVVSVWACAPSFTELAATHVFLWPVNHCVIRRLKRRHALSMCIVAAWFLCEAVVEIKKWSEEQRL
jgi:hypothetical protein